MNSDYEIKKTYWENGVTKKETPYYKNKKQGLEINKNDKGQTTSTVEYSDGLKDGYTTTFYGSGCIESKQLYKKGQKVDGLIVYSEKGNIVYSSVPGYSENRPICEYNSFCKSMHF